MCDETTTPTGLVVPPADAVEADWDAFVEAHPPDVGDVCPLVEVWKSRGSTLLEEARAEGFMPGYWAAYEALAAHLAHCEEHVDDEESRRLLGIVERGGAILEELERKHYLGLDVRNDTCKDSAEFDEIKRLAVTLFCPREIRLELWRRKMDAMHAR